MAPWVKVLAVHQWPEFFLRGPGVAQICNPLLQVGRQRQENHTVAENKEDPVLD